MINVTELFGGIGAPRKALHNLKINMKSADYVEIMKEPVMAYNAIFGASYNQQDIKTWKPKATDQAVELLIHGSPCQDWSTNGKNDVTTGRSILYERTLEIIEKEINPKPKVVIWENVTGLISKRNVAHFNLYLKKMESMGYTNSWKVLNAKKHGIAQNRNRVFAISFLGDKEFEFPKEKPLQKKLIDFIDRSVEPLEYQLSEKELSLFFEEDGQLFIRENNKRGKRLVENGDSVNVEFASSTTRRGRVQKGIVPTLSTKPAVAVYYDGILRRITPKECWLLMGFDVADFERAASSGLKETALYKLAGNSIAVPVLEEIIKGLITQGFIKADYFF